MSRTRRGEAGRMMAVFRVGASGQNVRGLFRVAAPLLLLAGMVAWSGGVYAVTCTSIATGGNWNAVGTWAGCAGGNGPVVNTPGSNDTAVIATTGVNVVTANVAITVGNVIINSGKLNIAGSNWTVNGTTTVNNSGTIDHTNTGGSATFIGLVTVNAGGTWANTINEAIVFQGGITNDGTFNGGTATQTFSASQSIGGTSPINFGGAVAVANGVTVTNTTTSGVAITGNLTAGNATSIWVNAANSTLNYGGALAPMGTRVFTVSANPNTVNYTGAAQAVNATVYHDLTLSGSGAKTMGATTINGDFTMSGTATTAPTGALAVGGNFAIGLNNTFTAGALAHSVGGNWNNSGTFTAGTGRVTFNGTAQQTLTGVTTFNNLTVNNAAGLLLANNITATSAAAGGVTLTSGIVNTGANTLTIPRPCATPSVTRTSGWVNGNLQKTIPAGASTCTFEVGGTSVYAPITATFIAGAAAANITAKTADGDHASIATSGLDPSLTANRSWSLTSTVAQATAFSAVFNFDATDLDPDTQPATLFNAMSFSGGGWATPATGTRTATSTQATGLTLAAATQKDFVVGEVVQGAGTGAGGFNVVENGASATAGKIYTKLAGTAFTLDLVALNVAHTAVDTTFKGEVKVELLDSSSGGALDANGCNAGWGVIQTLGTTPRFLSTDSGRKQNVSFTENKAWPNVRVRVSYPSTGTATLIGCSADNFSVRPVSLALTATGLEADATGASATATPAVKAGASFTLTATASDTGYTGTPTLDNAQLVAHAGAVRNGTLGGAFSAAVAGIASGTAFIYDDAGYFKFNANGLLDATFTAVDSAAGDCTADFSTSPVGGKYGCKVGSAATAYFGRFIPDHFGVTVNSNGTMSAACSLGGFTYTGLAMGYGTAPSLTIKPMNAATGGSVTQNYQGVFQKLTAANVTITAPIADGAQNGKDGLTRTTLAAVMSAGGLANSSGTLTYILAAGDQYTYTRNDNSLVGAYTSNIPLVVASVSDGEISSAGALPTLSPAGVSLRFGRLKLSNAYGSELLDLPIPIETQYWNGTAFVTNSADSCTTMQSTNIALVKTPSGCTTAVSGNVSFNTGSGNLKLTKPGAKCTADITVNLAAESPSKAYLQTGATYNQDPAARATFGVYKKRSEFIYLREAY